MVCEASPEIKEIRDDLKAIKSDIVEIKIDLATHIQRTHHNEKRIEMMEDFAKEALHTQQSNFKDMLKSNKDNQAALNRQLKIALTLFAALATFITAFSVFFH